MTTIGQRKRAYQYVCRIASASLYHHSSRQSSQNDAIRVIMIIRFFSFPFLDIPLNIAIYKSYKFWAKKTWQSPILQQCKSYYELLPTPFVKKCSKGLHGILFNKWVTWNKLVFLSVAVSFGQTQNLYGFLSTRIMQALHRNKRKKRPASKKVKWE